MFSQSIDQAKGLAILLVVVGHINSPIGSFIYSFHIPLFFFLAGLFIKSSYSPAEHLTKGFVRLIVPFMIFGVMGMVVTIIKNIVLHRPLESIAESLSGLLFWMDAPHMHHYGFVLWFLPALFWGRAIIFFVLKLKLHPAIIVSVSMSVSWLSAYYLTLPFGLDKGLVALPWILMGYLFYQTRDRWLSLSWHSIAGVLLGLLSFVYVIGAQRLDLATKIIGNPVLTFPYTMGVILVTLWLVHKTNVKFSTGRQRVVGTLAQFGRHSMLVLVLHVYTNNAADILVNYAMGAGYWFVTFAISVFVVYLFIQVKQRFADSLLFRYL